VCVCVCAWSQRKRLNLCNAPPCMDCMSLERQRIISYLLPLLTLLCVTMRQASSTCHCQDVCSTYERHGPYCWAAMSSCPREFLGFPTQGLPPVSETALIRTRVLVYILAQVLAPVISLDATATPARAVRRTRPQAVPLFKTNALTMMSGPK